MIVAVASAPSHHEMRERVSPERGVSPRRLQRTMVWLRVRVNKRTCGIEVVFGHPISVVHGSHNHLFLQVVKV